ncbi:MAG: DegT/DnrJ/EryC1/StrS family aminotransferase [Ignavibacteriae bacterium]|nr:MAG: DegT/DnrJ/EryC1/StrS family aminotransferase [Ignavibacteriota bacterium]
MNVPFVDLKTQYLQIKEEILQGINEVLDNTAYVCGKKVKKFEEDFSKLENAKYCVALSSGTDALHTALLTIGIKSGDEVIVPVNTFIATSESISLCNGKPVFVDHDERTFNIDVNKIEEKITNKTKAIIPVHLYGQPAEMDKIIEIAKKYKLYVIEDCSQAHLSEYKGNKTGTIGDIGTYSFYPGKNLGAYGEAGAVLTNNEELFNSMLRFRQHGSVEKYMHDSEGHNYRMEEIQAAVLNVKLRYIESWTEKRRQAAAKYNEQLANLLKNEIIAPYCPEYVKAVYHLYVIRAKDRDKLGKYLNSKGVQNALHYPVPLHMQKAYSYLKHKEGDFPVAEKCCKEILSIPMFPEISDEQINYVCESIKSFFD